MKMLVTGATGNIGGRVVDRLRIEHEVIAVGRRTSPPKDGVSNRTLDLNFTYQAGQLDGIIRDEHPDAIVHLAALLGGACEQDPQAAQRLNTSLTGRLALTAAKCDVKRFVFMSTAAVYAQTELQPTTEDKNVAPKSVYGRTKHAAELTIDAVAAASSTDTRFTTLRAFNAYGHGLGRSLVERLRLSSPESPVPLHGWENFHRDYVHADEIAEAVALAATHEWAADVPGHTVLNIASGVTHSNAALIGAMEAQGLKPHYELTGEGPPSYSWADTRRAVEVLGFQASQDLIFSH